jgi:hypothetical protein
LGFDDQADNRAGLGVQTILFNQILIHHGVEETIIDDIIDVAVDVIVHPPGCDRLVMEKVVEIER